MTAWEHQTDEPLYPEVIWSKPVTKRGAGKLLIMGGSSGAMSNLALSYSLAESAGIGTTHLLVPDSLAKITKGIPYIQYAPSNPSGGFARSALSDFLDIGNSVDGVLIAGDLGKNSETSLVLESFVQKFTGRLIIGSEALVSFTMPYAELLSKENILLFATLNQFREITIELKLEIPITSDITNSKLAEALRIITASNSATIVIDKSDAIWIAKNPRVALCKNNDFNIAKSTVWALQQPEKIYEALISSCLNEKS